jgi:hypothetical protein
MENKKQQPIDVPVRHGLREYSCKICKECIFFKEQTTPDLTTVQIPRDSYKTPPIITRLFLQEEKKKVRSVVLGRRADAGVWQTNVGREAHSEAPLRDGGSVETCCFNRKRE